LRPIHSLPHRRDGVVLGGDERARRLLVCISLAVILGSTARPEAGRSAIGAARRGTAPIGSTGHAGAVVFPVDEVQGMERFRTQDLKDVPATLTQAQAAYTRALVPLATGWSVCSMSSCCSTRSSGALA